MATKRRYHTKDPYISLFYSYKVHKVWYLGRCDNIVALDRVAIAMEEYDSLNQISL